MLFVVARYEVKEAGCQRKKKHGILIKVLEYHVESHII